MSKVMAPTGITSRDEQPAFFEAGDETLFGILTRPRTEPVDSALIMVPSAERLGYRNRVGVMLAHRLAALGHQVFRFNYRGCGESTGKAGRFRLDDPFTTDAIGATEWLRGQGVERFLYSGSCFGARTALAAAAREPATAGVIVVAMPMTDYASGGRGTMRTARAPLSSLARQTLRRKTLRGLRDRDVRRIYAEAARHKLRSLLRRSDSAGEAEKITPELLRYLTSLIERRVPLLFIYGEADSAYKEFLDARGEGRFEELLRQAGDAVEVRVIPGVLHGWTSIPAGETAVGLMTEWVCRVERRTRTA
jgi:pimeloyl-ACP methyl ester carboxylesterase